jgi:hypothetical protein
MSPEVERQWQDELARLRYERGAYAKRAADRRREAIELRKKRRWLDALLADDRASEYRRTRDQFDSEIKRIRQETGL